MVETRLREAVKGFRSMYKLQAGRGTPLQSRQNQPIRSSEVRSRRAHETRIVFVLVGFDATRKGVMKLRKPSKVVFHIITLFPGGCNFTFTPPKYFVFHPQTQKLKLEQNIRQEARKDQGYGEGEENYLHTVVGIYINTMTTTFGNINTFIVSHLLLFHLLFLFIQFLSKEKARNGFKGSW